MRRGKLAALLGALVLLSSGCSIGLGTAGGYTPSGELAGPLAAVPSLDGAAIGVGSKNFTENIVLGKLAVILLKSAGAEVDDLTNIPGSAAARQAQLVGQIQVMWEYTGTSWLTYLGHDDPIPDAEEQYVAVRDEDLAKHDLAWLPPAPLNNTYAMAVTAETAEKYGLTTLSDMAKVPVAERTYCVESEFTDRPDGLKGMLAAYGLPLETPNGVPRSNVRTLQTGAIYTATAKGACTFGEVFTTDGRIPALGLVPLEDDKRFFPLYNASVVIRGEVLEEHPQLTELFASVSRLLTNDVVAKLNADVDVDGREPGDVAYEWLESVGLIK